jgi:hypothetical protein
LKNYFEETERARPSQLSFHYELNGPGGMEGKNDNGKNKILSFKGTPFTFVMMMTTTQIMIVIVT